MIGSRLPLVALALLLSGSGAAASDYETWWKTTVAMSPRMEAQMLLTTGPIGRSSGAAGSVALERGSTLISKPVGTAATSSIPVALTRQLSKAGLVKVARTMAKGLGPAGVVLLGWDLVWEAYSEPDPQFPGVWKAPGDTGSQYPQGIWRSNTLGGTWTTAEGAISSVIAWWSTTYPNFAPFSYAITSVASTSVFFNVVRNSGTVQQNTSVYSTFTCGTGEVYESTVCVQAPYQVATDAQIDQRYSDYIGSDSARALDIATEIGAKGGDQDLVEESGSVTASGPASSPAKSSTTSTTSGGVTTVTTVTNSNQYSYSGDTVTITNITETTECVAGSCNTETVTETGDHDQLVTDAEYPEPIDICAEHPEAAMCQELGEAAPEPELTESVIDLTFSGEMSAAGSCPPPQTYQLAGGQVLTLAWTPVCTFAEGIRPIVILVAMLSAGIGIFLSVRRGDA